MSFCRADRGGEPGLLGKLRQFSVTYGAEVGRSSVGTRANALAFEVPFLAEGYLCHRNGPWTIGAPGEIRTPDPLVRSQVLYPTELRAR